jgi:hypothetical protein
MSGEGVEPVSPDHVSFLRARLNEDEQVAQGAVHDPDCAGAGIWTRYCGVVVGDIHIYDEGGHSPEQAEHIARWDPARVLAEVATKRRIIELCEGAIEAGELSPNTTWNDDAKGAVVAEQVLEIMTQSYLGHPDYDPAWNVA